MSRCLQGRIQIEPCTVLSRGAERQKAGPALSEAPLKRRVACGASERRASPTGGGSFDLAEPLVFERVVGALAHLDHPAHAARRRELLGAQLRGANASEAFGRQSTDPPTARPRQPGEQPPPTDSSSFVTGPRPGGQALAAGRCTLAVRARPMEGGGGGSRPAARHRTDADVAPRRALGVQVVVRAAPSPVFGSDVEAASILASVDDTRRQTVLLACGRRVEPDV
eukprot:scaffold13897_cov71-Phaeocystis_antarctica.AAC.1